MAIFCLGDEKYRVVKALKFSICDHKNQNQTKPVEELLSPGFRKMLENHSENSKEKIIDEIIKGAYDIFHYETAKYFPKDKEDLQ